MLKIVMMIVITENDVVIISSFLLFPQLAMTMTLQKLSLVVQSVINDATLSFSMGPHLIPG